MANMEPLVLGVRVEAEGVEEFDPIERALKKQKKAVADTLKRMKEYKDTVGMTADALEIYKLRQKGATDAQIEEAQELQRLINIEKDAIKQKNRMNGSLRLIRGGFGQLGHQVQDVAVQLQGGTDAMIVLGQQGGQIASLMGPGGAIVGAFLAVGAAAFTAFRDVEVAENKFEELKTTLQELTPAAEASAEAIQGAIAALQVAQMAESGKNIDKVAESMENQMNAARAAQQKMLDLESGQRKVRGGAKQTSKEIDRQRQIFQDQAGEAGRSLAQLIAYQKVLEDMGMQAATPELEALKAQVVELGKAAIESGEPLTEALFTPESVTEAKDAIAEITDNLLTGKDKINKQYQDMATEVVSAFQATGEVGSAEFIALMEKVNEARANAINEIDQREEEQAAREKARAKAKAEAAEKAAQREIDAKANAVATLEALQRSDVTDIDKINKRYDAELDRARKAAKDRVELAQMLADTEVAIEAKRTAAILALRDKEKQKHFDNVMKMRENALGFMRNETENFINNLMLRQQALDQALAQNMITREEHAEGSKRLEEMKAEHMLDQNLKIIGGLQNVENAITNASHAFVTGAASGTEAMRMLGKAIIDELIKSMIQIGIEKAKQALIAKNIEAGSLAASVASNATAMAAIAAASAPAATMVSLATAGGNAVGAQAGMTSTAALSKALSIPSADGGGFTGLGARSGGIDGKGGFLAMLHPNETVIDHTKGQGQGITIINNIEASGDGDVDQRIATAVTEASRQTVEQVHNMMRRGRM